MGLCPRVLFHLCFVSYSSSGEIFCQRVAVVLSAHSWCVYCATALQVSSLIHGGVSGFYSNQKGCLQVEQCVDNLIIYSNTQMSWGAVKLKADWMSQQMYKTWMSLPCSQVLLFINWIEKWWQYLFSSIFALIHNEVGSIYIQSAVKLSTAGVELCQQKYKMVKLNTCVCGCVSMITSVNVSRHLLCLFEGCVYMHCQSWYLCWRPSFINIGTKSLLAKIKNPRKA